MCIYAQSLSCICFFEPPWTIALLIPLSIEFSRQEYWSGLPFPVLRDLLDLGIEPKFLVSCIGVQILYHCTTWETLIEFIVSFKLIQTISRILFYFFFNQTEHVKWNSTFWSNSFLKNYVDKSSVKLLLVSELV